MNNLFYHLKKPSLLLKFSGIIILLFLFSSTLLAHTFELRAKLNTDGSTTFYARSYHSLDEFPSGGFIVDGVTYFFQGAFSSTELPAGTVLISQCNYTFRNTDSYQFVTIQNFNSCMQHSFSCTGGAPEAPLCNLVATLNLGGIPLSIQPPIASTLSCIGSSSLISVSATGSNLTYQWKINTGAGFVNVANNAGYSGAQTSTLTVYNVAPNMSGHIFKCVATATGNCINAGTITSTPVLLNIGSPLVIIAQPADRSVCIGSSTNFLVQATGANPSYQWQTRLSNAGNWNNINGAIAASFAYSGVAATDSGKQYRVLVAAGCSSAIPSNAATLIVETRLPAVVSQPVSSTVCQGNNTSFTVAATGNNLSYQWQCKINAQAGWTNVAAANNCILNLNAVTVAINSSAYRVKIGAACNNTSLSNDAMLIVEKPQAAFSLNNAAQCLAQNNFVFNNQSATNGTALTYAWDFDDGTVNAASNPAHSYAAAGAYTVKLKAISSAGCTNIFEQAITVLNNPVPQKISSGSVSICEGTVATLQVPYNTAYSYQWAKEETNIANATAAALDTKIAGNYFVRIYNQSGCVINSDTVKVNLFARPLTPAIQLQGAASFCEGSTLALSTAMNEAYQYKWMLNDMVIGGADKNFISIAAPGNYKVKITNQNGCGEISASTFVTVYPLPAKPSIQNINNLLISDAGTEYFWYRNEKSLAQKNTRNLAPDLNGSYQVKITNDYGCISPLSDAVYFQNIFITASPNPVKNLVTVRFSQPTYEYLVKVYNSRGQLMLQKNNVKNNEQFNMVQFADGTYYFKFFYKINELNQYNDFETIQVVKQEN